MSLLINFSKPKFFSRKKYVYLMNCNPFNNDVELVEEQVLKCTCTSTEILEATLIITGSSMDCNKVMQLKKKPATKKTTIPRHK